MAVDRGAFWCGPSRQGRLIRQDILQTLETVWRITCGFAQALRTPFFSESIREEYLVGFLMLDNRASDGSEMAGEIQPARLRPSMAHGHEAEAA